MSEKSTYPAVLLGPGTLGNGESRELEFHDGKHQEIVVTEDVVEGRTVRRTWRLGHESTDPVPYRFVSEDDGTTPSVQN